LFLVTPPCYFRLSRLFPFCRNWNTAVAMSILSWFLSGCHSLSSSRNSFARCSLGSTFLSTVSFANTCFLANAISGGSFTGAAGCATAALVPGAVGNPGLACPGEDIRLDRLRRRRRLRALPLELLLLVLLERRLLERLLRLPDLDLDRLGFFGLRLLPELPERRLLKDLLLLGLPPLGRAL